MYLNISHYTGMAEKIGEGAAKTQQGLVPLLRSQRGFLGYAAFASEQGNGISLHIWENADALNQSESASSSATERETSARHLAAGRELDATASTMPQPTMPGNEVRPRLARSRSDDQFRHDDQKRP